jgi:hypothetical protein
LKNLNPFGYKRKGATVADAVQHELLPGQGGRRYETIGQPASFIWSMKHEREANPFENLIGFAS